MAEKTDQQKKVAVKINSALKKKKKKELVLKK